MATFSSLYPYNPMLFVPTPSSNHPFASSFFKPTKFTVRSSHSNPKILKTNRKSIYGKTISPYDSDEESEEMDDDDDDDDDDWFSDDVSFPIFEISIEKLKWVYEFGTESLNFSYLTPKYV
jgi:mTERF domain-containing protein